MNGAGITIVGASAGSGKTHRLTQEVVTSVAADARNRVDVGGLLAVTFTRKAHDELAARIRHTLVAGGAYEEAMRLPLAYVGTVHAAALRLLQEFALDAGLSPNVDVVVGDEKKLLRQALERALDEEVRAKLDRLAARLELRMAQGAVDWVTPVAEIMELARSNRIPPAALHDMAERSVTSLLTLLPTPATDARALEAALVAELGRAEPALAKDDTKVTANARETIRKARQALADGELRWSQWQKLATLQTSKRCEPLVRDLQATAARYLEHPQLREDLRATTFAIFDAARAGLDAYCSWKRERRVVDYVDMLDGALDVVEHPRVRVELARRLQLVVVDEFQDTSPIQLALFVRLHAVAGRSLWVGDRKQCIFEYAGADPVLMDAVAEWVKREGGTCERLSENRRSRPELVEACSELFAEAFARHGLAREEVVVRAHRAPLAELARLPPLGMCTLGSTKTACAEALAEGVRRMLAAPDEHPVLDRRTREVRPLTPGDVAVLVVTNEHARHVAEALHARGVRATLARAGLLDTPEGTLVEAALRWLLDDGDAHAAAVIEALTGWEGTTAEAWLEDRLRQVAADAAKADRPWQRALGAVRPRLAHMAPTEALDATLVALDLGMLCARWPDPAQRVANLDALRAAAQTYEATCAQEREAATVAGLLRFFDVVRQPTLRNKEMLAADEQHVLCDGGAVVVSTYHKAKGLEWPVVVLAELDREERRDAFAVTPEPSASGFDPERPLDGRGIRYWPWPLGQTKKAPLRDAAEQSPEGRQVAAREDRERVRLLYVGFTRARDHLVLGIPLSRKGNPEVAWLDALCDVAGKPLIGLPMAAADGTTAETTIGALRVPTRVRRLNPQRPNVAAQERSPVWFARPSLSVVERLPYRIRPSAAEEEWAELGPEIAAARIGAVERLGSTLAVTAGRYGDDVLGNAVHAFLAADIDGLARERRLEIAEGLLGAAGLGSVVSADALVGAGDALQQWVARRWPRARWHREIPIEGVVASEHGERRVSGIIDLLLETDEGVVLVDHKTFPATAESAWRKKCREFVPQLAAYARLLEMSGVGPLLGCWVHLPVGGGVVEVERRAAGRPQGHVISRSITFRRSTTRCSTRRDIVMPLNLDQLRKLVAGDAVAIRGIATLEPAGGPGDKIFPPTHSVDDKNKKPGAKYAFETRRIEGRDATCVLIDSVQSQANRMEEALQALWADKRIAVPVVAVDFSSIAPEVGSVTSLTAPHRIADALLRDSLLDGQLFRLSDVGRSFTDASIHNAAALFQVCPTGLLFGLWDSTGPKGGLGAKFQRALVSEIVGINAVPGTKTESRIDPLNILKKASDIYVATDGKERWTTDISKAQKNNGEPVKFGKEGKPSEVNHGNVTPSIDSVAGGVTIDEARHTVVLSLASLRRLGFSTGAEEARTVLAALGLLAVCAAESRGHDLRSRCLLVPRKGFALKLEAVASDGSTSSLELGLAGAIALYNDAVGRLPSGIKFEKPAGEPLAKLTPSPKLADLVKKSRELAAADADVGDG